MIAGVGTTHFGKHLERSLSSLAHEAIRAALRDAGIGIERIQAVWAGTAAAPITTARAILTTRVRSSRRWSNRGIRPSGFSRRLARA